MSGNSILSLLGLALRGGRLAVGEEPVALAAKTGQARLLLVASDAASRTSRRAEHLAQEGHCLWLALPFSKEELGRALGRDSAAVAALTDTGLAAAVTERLAAQDPERYAEAAARMDLKRRRAKERQSAPRRDPPRKDPPPSRKDRRPPESRRRGGAERSPYASKDTRGPGNRPQGSGHPRKPDRPQGGGKHPPGEGRPYSKGPREGRGKAPGGKSGHPGKRPGPGAGRPYPSRGGPSAGGRNRKGTPSGKGHGPGGGSSTERGR